MLGDAFGGKNQPILPAPEDIEVTLECSLYELYNGCLKKVTYDKNILTHDGKTVISRREELNVEVKPGFSETTIVSYPSKGNEAAGHKPSKLVIKFKQTPHPNYRRKDTDLIYTHSITLE